MDLSFSLSEDNCGKECIPENLNKGDTEDCAFYNITVYPFYGDEFVYLKWNNAIGNKNKRIIVERSPDGHTEWKSINGDGQFNITEFVDPEFIPGNLLDKYHYRLRIGNVISNSVSFFDVLNKREFGMFRRMLQMEQLRMSRGNGMSVLYFRRKNTGDLSDNVNPYTRQQVAAYYDNDGVTNRFKGGFSGPIKTWLELNATKKSAGELDQQGHGLNDNTIKQSRMFATPYPQLGDLFINPRTNDRYVLNNISQVFYFKGNIPFMLNGEIELLPRDNLIYQLDINDIHD